MRDIVLHVCYDPEQGTTMDERLQGLRRHLMKRQPDAKIHGEFIESRTGQLAGYRRLHEVTPLAYPKSAALQIEQLFVSGQDPSFLRILIGTRVFSVDCPMEVTRPALEVLVEYVDMRARLKSGHSPIGRD